MKPRFLVLLALSTLLVCACAGKKMPVAEEHDAGPMPLPVAPVTAAPTAAGATAAATPIPPGSPPPDGKYERVLVDGVTVPMVEVMDQGATVLVDTDGKKPRTWEEQYKRKRPALKPGEYDLHKTDTNKNDKFDDDAIDREGRWLIDARGNITKG